MQDGVDLGDVQMEGAVPDGHLGALRAHAVARGRHRQLRRAAHLAPRSNLRPAKILQEGLCNFCAAFLTLGAWPSS